MENYQNIVDIVIFGLLGVMSVVSLAVGFERIGFYKKIDISSYKNRTDLEIELGDNLTIISTIASNAPYVGLLGTVVGIIITFYAIGANGLADTGVIMTGLGLALKATALGLVVAIPAIVFHNYLVRKMEVLLMRWDSGNQKN